MPGLLSRIDEAVGGLDIAALAGGTGGQLQQLAGTIGSWNGAPPGDFGAALGGLAGSVQLPNLSLAGSLTDGLSGILPLLQGGVGGLATQLGGDVSALPARIRTDLLGAVQPLVGRVETLRTLLTTDWSCGLVAGFAPEVAAPAPSPAPAPAPAPAPSPAPAPAAQGAISPAQVTAAQALIDKLPADLEVSSLLKWVHDRVGTFRPGYFTVRSLPLFDDIRDPLDTLVRWDAAPAAAVVAELEATVAALTAQVGAYSSGLVAAAVPQAQVAALPAAALGGAAEAFVAALEDLAARVQNADAAALPAALSAAQGARAALLAQNTALADAGATAAHTALLAQLAALPDALDAGLCRLLVLLQPRATLGDLTDAVGVLEAPALPPDALAPVTETIDALRAQLEAILGAVDLSAVTGPLTDALVSANAAVQSVEQSLAQLSAQAVQAIGQARNAVQAIDLDQLREQAVSAIEGVTAQATQAIGQAITPAAQTLTDAIGDVSDAIDDIDPEALAGTVRDAVQALGDVVQEEAVQRLVEVAGQLEQLAQTVATLSFAPVAEQVIALIGELNELIAGIDIESLPDPGPALIGEAMKLLPQSLVPLTDPLVVDLDTQIAGAPTALLEQVKTLPDQARARLLGFSPRQALQPVLSDPFRAAVAELDRFAPSTWLDAGDAALEGVRRRIAAQLDVAKLLAEPAQAFGTLTSELDKFRPSTLLAPVEQAIENAVQQVAGALPIGDLASALNAALGRITLFTRTLDSALGVASHLTAKLAALGDARAEFDDWLDTVCAKVPATATGTLATRITELRNAALGARAGSLDAAWATVRTPLAGAMTAADATNRLTRLALARSRIQAGLTNPVVTGAVPTLAAWFDAAQTKGAGDGLNVLAALQRALAAADAGVQAQIDAIATRFPHPDGPLAPLLPGDAAVRGWVREAFARQLGVPILGLLASLKPVAAMIDAAVAALQALVDAIDAKLADLLSAPQALADLLGSVSAVQQRLASLDLGIYTREVDTVYTALLDELRALDPMSLKAPLEQARDALIGQLSLRALLPPALRGELDAAYRTLVAKLASLDPDKLLLEPLDAEYREAVEPLVEALDISATVQVIIDWLNGLPEDLRVQISRVDGPYGELLRSAPGGASGGASVSL